MGWKTDVQGPWQCCQMLCDGHCLDDVDRVLQRRPSSERNRGWRSRRGKQTWGGQARSAGQRAVRCGLCNSSSQWVRASLSILKTQTHSPPHASLNLLGEAAHHVVLVGSKGMTSVPGYKPGRAARGGGTACPKARRAPALCPLHKPAQPSEGAQSVSLPNG